VALEGETLETASDHWELRGSAHDEDRVEDVSVLVSNDSARIDRKKVFYASNRGNEMQSWLDFTASIPLWPGSNMIAVVAREDDDVRTTRALWIYRSSEAPSAAVPSPR
jgi:hypothetical protein